MQRSKKMTRENTKKFVQNSAEHTGDMSLMVWIVRQLLKKAHLRNWRDPDRIKSASKKLEDALEKKRTSRILVNQLVRDRRISKN